MAFIWDVSLCTNIRDRAGPTNKSSRASTKGRWVTTLIPKTLQNTENGRAVLMQLIYNGAIFLIFHVGPNQLHFVSSRARADISEGVMYANLRASPAGESPNAVVAPSAR